MMKIMSNDKISEDDDQRMAIMTMMIMKMMMIPMTMVMMV